MSALVQSIRLVDLQLNDDRIFVEMRAEVKPQSLVTVAVPILIAAMGGGEEGLRILRRCGFNGEQGNWNGYRV